MRARLEARRSAFAPAAAALLTFVASLAGCSSADGSGAADSPAIDAAVDATAADAAGGDAGTDSGAADSLVADVSAADGGAPLDGGGPGDAGAATPDATACVPRDGGAPAWTSAPALLSETGLYADTPSKTLAPGVEPFAPAYVLWSDGAIKTRWALLPECGVIDTSDMDHWALPPGTRLFKEFVRNGVRVETRMIARVGPGAGDFVFAAYLWNDDERDAALVPAGVLNARGTPHDVPSEAQCMSCHGHLRERALGFSAIQLSHTGPGVTIGALSRDGRLSVPAPAGFSPPGDAASREALGYLHANCGNCHNATIDAVAFATPFDLRLSVHDVQRSNTGLFRTAIGVPVERFVQPGVTHRISPGDSAASCVPFRMGRRGTTQQMPPIGSEIPDAAGLAKIQTWIESL